MDFEKSLSEYSIRIGDSGITVSIDLGMTEVSIMCDKPQIEIEDVHVDELPHLREIIKAIAKAIDFSEKELLNSMPKEDDEKTDEVTKKLEL